MKTPSLDPDDPRLTAYALGESSPDEREAVEQLLVASPEARAEVEQIVALARDLRAEYRQENEAYWDARRVEPPPGKIIEFPNSRRARRKPMVALAWKIAAVLVALGALAPLALRRAPLERTASPASPPLAATNPPPLAAVPPAGATPATYSLAQARAAADADLDRPPAAAPEPAAASSPESGALPTMDADVAARDEIAAARATDLPASPTFDRTAAASKPAIRRAMTAVAPPGAPAANAYAPSTGGGSISTVDWIGRSLVRIRTGDGSFVAGVAISAGGGILAARPLSHTETRPTVIFADGREHPAMAVRDDLDARLFRLNVAEKSLPVVVLAASAPADKDELTVASTDRHTGTTRYQRARSVLAGTEALLQWTDQPPSDDETSLVFNPAGELLEIDANPSAAKAVARSRSAGDRSGRAQPTLRPFSASERARLLAVDQGHAH